MSLHETLGGYAAQPWHRAYLKRAYAASWEQVVETGADPLQGVARPRVLLCGSGSAETTATFAAAVHRVAPDAELVVVDAAAAPLAASAKETRAEYLQADARALPFAAGAFHWIETDFFLQYFDEAGKRALFAEWRRALAPTGVITTRDYILDERPHPRVLVEAALDRARVALLSRTLGVALTRTTCAAVAAALAATALDAHIESMAGLPLVKQLVARHAP